LDSIVGHQHIGGSDARSFRTTNFDQFAGDIVRIRFTAFELSNRSVSNEGLISLDNIKDYLPTLTSINDNAGVKSTFQLFPNPTPVEFTIRVKGFKGEQINLSLMDLQGRIV
jgi:hypothetical protein